MSGVTFKVAAETAQANQRLDHINNTLLAIKGSANTLSSTFTNTFRNLAIAAGSVGLVSILKNASDASIQLVNRLNTVAYSTEAVARAQRDVLELAMSTKATTQATVELYTRYAKSGEQLSATTAEILSLTRLTAQAIQLSGTGTESATAAVIQLGQGLSAGVLRGEELNSVLEQAPRLAQAIADGIGTSVGNLRTLGLAGKLTSDTVFKSLLSQATTLNEEFGKTTFTMTNHISALKVATSQFAAEALKGIGSGGIGAFLESLAGAIYKRSETIQADIASLMVNLTLTFNKVKALAGAVFSAFQAIGRQALLALPALAQSRTLIGDILSGLFRMVNAVRGVLQIPMETLGRTVREVGVYFKTFFGLLDFKVPAAMRDIFNARSMAGLTKGFQDLAKGIDSNTNWILSRLSQIPRSIKYFTEDIGIYLGIINKPVTFRLGYFEPILDSLHELRTSFVDNVKWARSFWGSFSPLGQALQSVSMIVLNLAYIFYSLARAVVAAMAAILIAVSKVVEALATVVKNFFDKNTFFDIFASTTKYLSQAFENIQKFAKNTIAVFKEIWDAVIGHSWWTDTINSIVDTSNSLWDRASHGLNRFSHNTIDLFANIFKHRPVHDLLGTAKDSISNLVTALRVKISNVDFVDLGTAVRAGFLKGLATLRDDLGDILKSIGVGMMLLGLITLFPSTALAKAISVKAMFALVSGLVIVSDKFTSQLTGTSPLGVVATTMGEVIGRELYRFIRNVPEILDAMLGTVVGFFRGFVKQIPLIGGMLSGITNISGVGNVFGLIGSLLLGKSVLQLFNVLGLIKTTPAQIVSAFKTLFTLYPSGLVNKALFGVTGTAILGMILLWNGAFDNLLDNNKFAKVIAGGGLAAMILWGVGGASGTVLKGLTGMMKGLTGPLSMAMSWLSSKAFPGVASTSAWTTAKGASRWSNPNTWTTSPGAGMPSNGATIIASMGTIFERAVTSMKATWANFTTYLNTTTFGSFIASQFLKVELALVSLRLKLTAFAATPFGKFLMNKWTAAVVIGGAAMAYAGSSHAGTTSPSEGPTSESLKTKIGDTLGNAFKFAIENPMETLFGGMIAITSLRFLGKMTSVLVGHGPAIWKAIITWGPRIAGALGVIGTMVMAHPAIAGILGIAAAGGILYGFFLGGKDLPDQVHDAIVKIERMLGISRAKRQTAGEDYISNGLSASSKKFLKEDSMGAYDPTAIDNTTLNTDRLKITNSALFSNLEKSLKDYDTAINDARKTKKAGGELSSDQWKLIGTTGNRVKKTQTAAIAGSMGDPIDILGEIDDASQQQILFFDRVTSKFRATGELVSAQWDASAHKLANLNAYSDSILKVPYSDLSLAELQDYGKVYDNKQEQRRLDGTVDSARRKFTDFKTVREKDYSEIGGKVSILMTGGLPPEDEQTLSAALSQVRSAILQEASTSTTQLISEQLSNTRISQATIDGANETIDRLLLKQQADKKIAEYQGRVKAAVAKAGRVGAKVDITDVYGMNEHQLENLDVSIEMLGRYDEALAKTNNWRDATRLNLSKALELDSIELEKAFNETARKKGLPAAQIERGKLLGYESLAKMGVNRSYPTNFGGGFTAFGASTTNIDKNEEQMARGARLQRLRAELQSDSYIPADASDAKRIELKDAKIAETAAARKAFEEGLLILLTPTEAAIAKAELLGITLTAPLIKQLNSPITLGWLTRALDKQLWLKNKEVDLPASATPAVVDKVTHAATKGKSDLEERISQFTDPKKLMELFSKADTGISIESVLHMEPKDFDKIKKSLKDLDNTEMTLSHLGAGATKAAVDPLLKRKFTALNSLFEQAAKIAHDSVEKIGTAIASLNLTDVTPITNGVIAFANSLDSVNKRLEHLSKQSGTSNAYLAFSNFGKLAAVIKSIYADIADTTFGGQLEHVNQSLKLTLSEFSMANLPVALQSKLNNFAIYYKAQMASIKGGKGKGLFDEAIPIVLAELEKGLRAAGIIGAINDLGKQFADAMVGSLKTQYDIIKANLPDFNLTQGGFAQQPRAIRDTTLEHAVSIAKYDRAVEFAGSSNALLKLLQPILTSKFDPAVVETQIELFINRAKEVFPNRSTADILNSFSGTLNTVENALISQFKLTGEDLRGLTKEINALRSVIAGTYVVGGSVNPLTGDTITRAQDHASGGHIRGPGTGTSDSIPAMLSNGEFVINAKSTKKNRSLLERINRGVGHFAGGGIIDYQNLFGGENFGLLDADLERLAKIKMKSQAELFKAFGTLSVDPNKLDIAELDKFDDIVQQYERRLRLFTKITDFDAVPPVSKPLDIINNSQFKVDSRDPIDPKLSSNKPLKRMVYRPDLLDNMSLNKKLIYNIALHEWGHAISNMWARKNSDLPRFFQMAIPGTTGRLNEERKASRFAEALNLTNNSAWDDLKYTEATYDTQYAIINSRKNAYSQSSYNPVKAAINHRISVDNINRIINTKAISTIRTEEIEKMLGGSLLPKVDFKTSLKAGALDVTDRGANTLLQGLETFKDPARFFKSMKEGPSFTISDLTGGLKSLPGMLKGINYAELYKGVRNPAASLAVVAALALNRDPAASPINIATQAIADKLTGLNLETRAGIAAAGAILDEATAMMLGNTAFAMLNTAISLVPNPLAQAALRTLMLGGVAGYIGYRTYNKESPTSKATGGFIHGPGTGTSDSIPAMLSDGEFVINAKSSKRYGSLLHAINQGTVNHFQHGTLSGDLGSGTFALNPVTVHGYNSDEDLRSTMQTLRDAIVLLVTKKDMSGAPGFENFNSLLERFNLSKVEKTQYLHAPTEALNRMSILSKTIDLAPTKENSEMIASAKRAFKQLYDKVFFNMRAAIEEAGNNFGANIRNDFTTGLKSALKGKGGFTIKGLLSSLTGNVIDTFVNGFTQSVMGPQSTFGILMTKMGGSLFTTGTELGGGDISKELKDSTEKEFIQALREFSQHVFGNIRDMLKVDSNGTPLTKDGQYAFDDGIGGTGVSLATPGEETPSAIMKGGFNKIVDTWNRPDLPFASKLGQTFSGLGDIFSGGLKGLGGIFSGLLPGLLGGGGGGGSNFLMKGLGFAASFFGGSPEASLTDGVARSIHATGGLIRGAGTGTSDSIAAMLSNGEFVVNAAATKEYSALLQRINTGRMPKFAAGGLVGSAMLALPMAATALSAIPASSSSSNQSVFNITITGDISRQTRSEIMTMLPHIANGVNAHNREIGYKTH